jgi:cyclohexa-1,5-dienecarbonyl-CoA hydratase
MMEYKHIAVSEAGGIGTVVLKRAPLNVLNIEMMKEINHALDGFKGKAGLKALVISAEGKAFSAGVDVGEHTGAMAKEMIEVFHGMFRRLDAIEAPTVALVKGAALGGGCELAIYCDLVLASDKAKFGQPEIQVGVFPPIAALEFPRLMGLKKSLELILLGDTILAGEAKALGLVNQVYPIDTFDAEAGKLLDKLRALSAPVLKFAKKATLAGAFSKPGALEDIEKIYMDGLMRTEDANEGLKAFLEKRQPVWKDK